MSFQEKSTWIMGVAIVGVYGWYFAVVFGHIDDRDIAEIAYRPLMLITVVVLVIVAAVAHAIVAVAAPAEADRTDVRDREINRWGEYVGGYVLGVAVLAGLAAAMFEVEHFWIANLLLLGLVLSELVSLATRAVLYRRGI